MEKQGQEIHWLDGATSLTENLAYILQAVGSKHSIGITV
jgi:hypothetical protein